MLGPNPEFVAPPEKFLFRDSAHRRVVNPHIVEMHPTLVLAVEAANIGTGAACLEDNRDAVERLVTRMKHMTGHWRIRRWRRSDGRRQR